MRVLAATVLSLLVISCGPRGADPGGESPAPTFGAVSDDLAFAEGKQAFEEICAECHTLDPPPSMAPPMRMVSMHLRDAFTEEQEGIEHILSYVPNPDPERSILPAHAVERFGLMAPLPLPEATLEAVARYVWSLSDRMSEGQRHRGGEHDGQGMRVRMRRRGGG